MIKLMKIEKNTRLFNAGDPSNDLLIVLRGQLGIIYPSSLLMELQESGPEEIAQRAELLTEAQAEQKKSETFITGQKGSGTRNIH